MIQKSQKNKSFDSFASVGIGILSLEGVMRMRAEDENEISKWGFGKREKLELKDCSLE